MLRIPFTSLHSKRLQQFVLVGVLYFWLKTQAPAESVFDTRYQYYVEDDGRVRVDSSYSLFRVDLNDTVALDGTLLYSAISGASPTGLPGAHKGSEVPVVELEDERYAATLGLGKKVGSHALKLGLAYSYESDYTSRGISAQDTISLNEKNTDLTIGFAYTDDKVGANGSTLEESKRSYDAIIGVNQILGPDTLLTVNLQFGWRDGFLADPYKRVLLDNEVFFEDRPGKKFEQIVYAQLTQAIKPWDASVDLSYRFGHNDFGTLSNTFQVALNTRFFDKRLLVRPMFRYYRQTAADFYDTSFSGTPDHYSSDYRLAAEETYSLGLQIGWELIPERLRLNLGYERYITRGTDGKTSQSAFPDAHSITAGMLLKF